MPNDIALTEKTPTTLLLSADTTEALEATTQRLAAWVSGVCKTGQSLWPLPEVAVALRDRAKPSAQRRAIRVDSWQDARAALADKARQITATALTAPKLFLAFPGQGSLRPGVLARLLAGTPAWARLLAGYTQLAHALSGFDAMDWLGDPDADADSVLKDNAKTQLAIFCVGASLARWLLDRGLRTDGYVGHSLGEWIGAHLAAVLNDKHAIRAVHHRGRLMQATGPGAALIVRASLDALAPLLSGDCALACVNAPNLCLVSGRPDAIAACAQKLAAARIVCRPAPIHVAVHSAVMEPVLEPFLRELAPLTFTAPKTQLLSSVTGDWMSGEQACDRTYWTRQVRRPVRFDKAAATLLAEPAAVILEVGMGSTLTSLITAQARGSNTIRAFALLGRDEPPEDGYDPARVQQTLGELWASGVAIDPVGDVKLTRSAPTLPL